jgi:hypothetical protein
MGVFIGEPVPPLYDHLSLGRCHMGPRAHMAHMLGTHSRVPCSNQTPPIYKVVANEI